MSFSQINVLLVDQINPATVYAGTNSGFYKSTNGGANWSHSSDVALAFTRALLIDPAAPSTLYAGTDGKGIYKSTDGGDSWVAVRNGLQNSFINALAINPQNTMTVYAGASPANDGCITKLNANGSALVYSTYLGGDEPDFCSAIAVDAAGNAYVTGETHSPDFPTVNPLRGYSGYTDAFVSKLNNSGTALVYSTHLGGSYEDRPSGIAVDATGSAYVVGTTFSNDFPAVRPVQAAFEDFSGTAFVAKLTASGTALAYSTYLGGGLSVSFSGVDQGFGIAVDAKGNAYVTGLTYADDFPITPNAFQTTKRSEDGEAFITKISDYDICMQDETNGNLLQINSTSGDYRFTNCRKGIVYTGKGTVTVRGCKTTLTARAAGQTLTALVNTCSRVASAELITQGKSLTITDNDMANNMCGCK